MVGPGRRPKTGTISRRLSSEPCGDVTAARQTPNRLAREFVPPDWLTVLCDIRYKPSKSKRPPLTPETTTAHEFYREIAKLGGFLGRKSDGEPGWQTLWRGFEKLHLFIRGYQAKKNTCG